MSTVNYTSTATGNSRSTVITWPGLANGDDGQAISLSQYTDRTVQVVGTFGAGGSVRIEGSNNGTDWAVLTDPQGNDLNIATAKIEMVSEATWYIRPRVTAGDSFTALSVHLFVKE